MVHLINRNAEYGLFDRCRDLNVSQCIECGLCAYNCPAHRPLIHYIKYAMAQIEEADRQNGEQNKNGEN